MCNTILMGVEVEMGLWEGLCVYCGYVLSRVSACGLPHAYVVGSTHHPQAVSDHAHGAELHAHVWKCGVGRCTHDVWLLHVLVWCIHVMQSGMCRCETMYVPPSQAVAC